MGDTRFDPQLRRLAEAADKAAELRRMSDEEVVQALAAASRSRDAYMANVLATEAMNRMRRARALSEAVAASEARYRALFHSSLDPLVAADLERRITDCNPAFEELLGYEARELRGLDTLILYADATRYDELRRATRERMLMREIAVVQVSFRTKAGEEVPVELHGFPLVDAEGNVLGFVARVRDLRAEAGEGGA